MAAPYLQKAQGNGASTTASGAITNTDTTVDLSSDSEFDGEGMILMDEGQPTEELAYATGKSGATLTIPLANRGLEGGSAQGHTGQFTIKGILTSGMWNNIVAALTNLVSASTGAVDLTKVVTPGGSQTLTNKTLTSPSMTSPSVTSGDVNLATGLNIQVNSADPYKTIVIPAGSMSPTTTAGCASAATVETSTNKINYKVLDFDKATEEHAFVNFNMPASYDGGTLLVSFEWTSTAASGDVVWGIEGRAFANDDAADQAVGTAQTVTDTITAANDFDFTSETSALTLAGTPAGGQAVYLQVFRKAADGADTLDADARLKSVIIRYKIAQYSD